MSEGKVYDGLKKNMVSETHGVKQRTGLGTHRQYNYRK